MAYQKSLKLTAFLMASTLSSMSYGAGFAIIEQSVTGLGRAFSGSAAVADDASTIFFNPAGLTQLKHMEVDMGMHVISPNSEFNDGGSTSAFNAPLTGGDGGNAGSLAPVPNLYIAIPINDKIVAGLGVSAPFGLVTEYNDTWKGRYHAVKSDMLTINFNPSIAFKASEKLSLGFGVNLQYIDLELTQMADLGAAGGAAAAIGAGATDPAVIGAAAALGSQTSDGKVKLEADDWSWGYNIGMMFQATDATRLGLAYRSKISHTLKGDGELSHSGAVLAAENIQGDVDLPENVSFAVHHQINNKLAVMADATWTRWDRFEKLEINSSGGTFDTSKAENWDNSMRYGVGLTYDYDSKWIFRTGVAYDETPISDEYRTARIPGEDRKWLAVGASYKYSDNMMIDAGYTHIFLSDPKINEVDDNGYTLTGDYEASVDILSVQMRWLFL